MIIGQQVYLQLNSQFSNLQTSWVGAPGANGLPAQAMASACAIDAAKSSSQRDWSVAELSSRRLPVCQENVMVRQQCVEPQSEEIHPQLCLLSYRSTRCIHCNAGHCDLPHAADDGGRLLGHLPLYTATLSNFCRGGSKQDYNDDSQLRYISQSVFQPAHQGCEYPESFSL